MTQECSHCHGRGWTTKDSHQRAGGWRDEYVPVECSNCGGDGEVAEAPPGGI